MDDSPLLVAQMDTPQVENTGDFYYRTLAPGIGMARCEGVYTIGFTNVHRLKYELMGLADVLIINNVCDADILPLIRDRKADGKITIYELCDDLADIPPSNPLSTFYAQSKNLLLIKRLANYCDALQFSSDELQRKYGYLNGITAVFPNQMLEIPPEVKSKHPETVTIGWGGSLGHFADLKKIAGPLADWFMSKDDVRLHLMCGKSFQTLFDKLPKDRIKWVSPGSLQDYYRFVSQLDIGLAPLEDIAFNRSRSDIKFLEYAAHGVVPVMQATGPYLMSVQHGKTGFLFHSTDELISILDELTFNVAKRTEVASAAHAYVVKERNQLERGRERVQFCRRLLAAAGWKRRSNGPSVKRTFDDLCKCAGAIKSGRNLFLSSTRYELLLTGGLTVMSDKASAKNMFQEAIRINPALHMPYLFSACVCDDAIQSLKIAVEKNPRSITSWLHLGSAFGSKGMSAQAIESFRMAADIFPEYEQPYIECANYLDRIGMKQQGIDLLKKAISVIPEVIRSGAVQSTFR
jgi:glycosyltransferase involved in cell wall biosynthesis